MGHLTFDNLAVAVINSHLGVPTLPCLRVWIWRRRMLISRILVLALTIAWSSTSPMEAQSIFDDDFSRPDGSIANGWTVWGNLNTTLAGGEVRTFGSPGVAGGIGRTLPVSFPIHFSFDFRTLNTNADPTQAAS